ncbi:helix-turn-helix domain-containing protein [Paenibacillus endoradicis]|uniref:helix-turn-helix domain-containing protein n=1 Tax=Paenibacillus endoradicis TaxID=2972487 RepID=UPI0021596110|nr:helix-turn-helix domain-containing protein [Paenibacillus endoradicis]MCR8657512.1 helix-turn-helix domain-containing protein [Paenibacillus endoradicis]
MQKQFHKTDLSEVRQYIEENFTKQLSLGHLADITGLSSSYFSSAFKQAYHQSPMEFVTQLRIQKAKQLLQNEDVRMKFIAEAVGYSDEFYFSRVFKKVEGVPPTIYSGQQKSHIGVVTGNMMGYLHAAGLVPFAAPLSAKWTPYYFNLWKEQIEHKISLINNKNYCNLNELFQLQFDLLISPRDLPSEMVKLMEDHFPIYWLDDKKNCLMVLTELAVLLNRKKEAEQWITQYKTRLEEIRGQLGWIANQPKVLIIRIYQSHIFAYCNTGIQHLIYQDLGAVASYEHSGTYNEEITLDELAIMNVDKLFTIICPDDESRATWHHLQRNIGFKQLEAVKDQQTYVIHSDPWFEYSPIALRRMLEEVAFMMIP